MKFATNPENMSKEQLLAYIYDLEARLSEVSPKHDDVAMVMSALSLTQQEARVLLCLKSGRAIPTEQVRAICAGPSASLDSATTLVRVVLSKLRKKLSSQSIVIENVYGIGYKLSGGVDVLQEALNAGRYE